MAYTYRKLTFYRQLPDKLGDWFAQGNILALPPGKYHAVTGRQNYPDSFYLNGGASHIAQKGALGDPNVYQQVNGTPISKQYIFTDSPQLWRDYRPNKTVDQWTVDEAEGAVKFLQLRQNGIQNMWIGAIEDYNGAWQWRMDMSYSPKVVKRVYEVFGAIQDAVGGWVNLDYGGNLYLQIGSFNQADLRPAVATNDASLAWNIAHENQVSQYYKQRIWENADVLISGYRINKETDYQFLYRIMIQLQLTKQAMLASGVTRKRRIIDYYMPEGIQVIAQPGTSYGYTEGVYTHLPFSGGTLDDNRWFPTMSYTSAVGQAALSYLWCDMRAQWSDNERHGVDPSIIRPDAVITTNGGAYTRKDKVYHEFQQSGTGITGTPYSFQNGHEDGARWIQKIYEHTGTMNWQFCAYRGTANGATYCDNGNDYLINRYLEHNPFAVLFSGVNGKKAILGVTPEGNVTTRQFNLGSGAPFEMELPANAPFCYLID